MLTAKRVERTRRPGRYRDGTVKGLLLQISDTGAKSFVLRYMLDGHERMMGLGSAADFSLREARDRARAARQLLADGVDPLDAKHQRKTEAKLAKAKKLTFAAAAVSYFNQHESKWTSASHRDQFMASLKAYAFPVLADMDVAAIALADVLRVIEPHWTTKNVTMDRVRNRIENVLDWCVVRGHRAPGTNPAKWKGHLDQVLPVLGKTKRHHAALAYAALPAFMAELRAQEEIAARALEFTILAAARTGETLGATWGEVDFTTATWTVPAERMKGKREHRVPLSPQAVELLRGLPREEGNPHVFIGPQAAAGLGGMTLARLLKRMNHNNITVHGFRSAFSDWAHEQTSHVNHTIELSLAHSVGSEVERSYRRGNMFAKRIRLMVDWARFATSPLVARTKGGAEVVPIGGGR
jgi:integrase